MGILERLFKRRKKKEVEAAEKVEKPFTIEVDEENVINLGCIGRKISKSGRWLRLGKRIGIFIFMLLELLGLESQSFLNF